MDWKDKLTQIVKKPPLWDEPLSGYTSIGIGGRAESLVFPQSHAELQSILSLTEEFALPFFILGAGTNLLIRDGGIKGIVISLSSLSSYYSFNHQTLSAGAAVPLSLLAKMAARRDLKGLEFAAGIPGSLGGALYMNAGAFGFSIGEFVREAEIMDYDGNTKTLRHQELKFAYRQSCFQNCKAIILGAVLELSPSDGGESKNILHNNRLERRSKQPALPSAGSVFCNPPGLSAGKLLDDLGVKGLRAGGAMVSLEHANFVVNTGDATASDVLSLIEKLQDKVRKAYKIDLSLEIVVVGEDIKN